MDRPGLIFNAINLKISQLIGLIVVYDLFQIDSLKIEVRTSSSDPDPKLIITDYCYAQEGELVAKNGSHEAVVFHLVPSDGSIPQAELMKVS